MPTDNKKAWSLIHKTKNIIANMISDNTDLQAIKTSYQSHNPDTNAEGFPLTAQEVIDTNAMITAHNTFVTDHAATITMLQNKNVGSHKGNALD